MRHPHHTSALVAALVAAGLGLLSCVPDAPSGPEDTSPNDEPEAPAPPRQPATGSLTTGVSTSGVDMPDSVSVNLDAGAAQRLPSSGSFTWSDLAPGDHLVELSGLPGNCAPDGENPRIVTVESDQNAVTLFTVSCSPSLGEIHVLVTTTSDGEDDDGYRVEVEGDGVSLRVDVGRDAALTFPDLAPGQYRVRLRDVDKECDVADDDQFDVEVTTGERVEVAFRVDCDD
jgi:hypothetical protein